MPVRHVHAHHAPPAPASTQIRTRVDAAARLALSATLTDHAADLADREDLVVKVAPGVEDTYGAQALIHHPTATIHLDAGLFETDAHGKRCLAPSDPTARRATVYAARSDEGVCTRTSTSEGVAA